MLFLFLVGWFLYFKHLFYYDSQQKIYSQFCHNVIHAFLKVIALYKTQRMCGENRVKSTTLKNFMSDTLNKREKLNKNGSTNVHAKWLTYLIL